MIQDAGLEAAAFKEARDNAEMHLRRTRKVELDRHMVMLRELKDSAEDGTSRLEELTDEMTSNDELPAERYMR